MPSPNVEPVGPVRAHHGEGALWDPVAGALRWIDVTGRAVHRTATDGTTTTVPTADDVGFVVPAADGSLLAGVGREVVRLDPAPGRVAAVPPGSVPLRTNDAGTDPAGRLWFGTMARDESPGHGTLRRLGGAVATGDARPSDDASATPVLDGLGIPNGPVWSPDGTTMYFTDTPTGLVRGWAFDAATGVLGAARVVVDTATLEGDPDGMAVDVDGNLWIAFWGGGAVRCFSPAGRLLDEFPLPVSQPTRPAWGGTDGRTLYVTTSRKGLDDDALAREPLAGRLLVLDPGAQGVAPPAAVAPAG